MVKIIYVEHSGAEHTVEVPEGWSLMEGAVKNRVPGIDAECGGACACATCHAYVEGEWAGKVPPLQETEESLLGFAQDRRPTSRLSCQIKVTPELEGFVLRLPKSQA